MNSACDRPGGPARAARVVAGMGLWGCVQPKLANEIWWSHWVALGLRHVQRWTSNSNVAKSCEGTSRAPGRPSGPGGAVPPGPDNPGVTQVGRLNHEGQSMGFN